jgi:hypothetical protein
MWTFSWAMGAACLGMLAKPAARRLPMAAAHSVVGVVLIVVAHTLWRSGYTAQTLRLLALIQGLTVASALWHSRALRLPWDTVRRGALVVCVVSLLGVWRAHMGQGHAQGALLPAWRHAAEALGTPGADNDEVADLLWLEAVGAQDAAFVRVAQALEQNAAAQTLRPMCPRRGWRGPLHHSWLPLVRRGRAICRAVTSVMPEAGMAWLRAQADAEGDAGLSRLMSDLAWETGDRAQAEAWAQRATRLGDAYATANTGYALGLRGHPVREIPSPQDPSGAAIWAKYNSAMHFDDFAVDSHHGLACVDAPARLGNLYDPERRHWVLTMQSSYGLSAGLQLPTPAGAPMPAALRLHIRPRGALRVRVQTSAGQSQTFDCDRAEASVAHADADDAHRPLPPEACQSRWVDVILPLRPGPQGASLTEVRLYGEFMLAAVEAIAARVAFCDQTADTGHDLQPDAEQACPP